MPVYVFNELFYVESRVLHMFRVDLTMSIDCFPSFGAGYQVELAMSVELVAIQTEEQKLRLVI